MDTAIVVALIGVLGSVLVAVLNHLLSRRVRAQEDKIARLYALSMSADLFGQLRKLASDDYGPYWVDPELRVGLAPELNYLKMLGYIRFDRDAGVTDLRDLPTGENPQLSRYVGVNPAGREFIALRERAVKQE
jgi:hypothetical protein